MFSQATKATMRKVLKGYVVACITYTTIRSIPDNHLEPKKKTRAAVLIPKAKPKGYLAKPDYIH